MLLLMFFGLFRPLFGTYRQKRLSSRLFGRVPRIDAIPTVAPSGTIATADQIVAQRTPSLL